ncbi:MAG: hypothetical protein KGL35_00445, partial [Bradyrhizobium sp.]|nr:hypothetical protein [Bradyrhizobium sp.]
MASIIGTQVNSAAVATELGAITASISAGASVVSSVNDYSPIVANNTNMDGVNVAPGCEPQ